MTFGFYYLLKKELEIIRNIFIIKMEPTNLIKKEFNNYIIQLFFNRFKREK